MLLFRCWFFFFFRLFLCPFLTYTLWPLCINAKRSFLPACFYRLTSPFFHEQEIFVCVQKVSFSFLGLNTKMSVILAFAHTSHFIFGCWFLNFGLFAAFFSLAKTFTRIRVPAANALPKALSFSSIKMIWYTYTKKIFFFIFLHRKIATVACHSEEYSTQITLFIFFYVHSNRVCTHFHFCHWFHLICYVAHKRTK